MFLPIHDEYTPDAPFLGGGGNGYSGGGQLLNVINTGTIFAPFGFQTVVTSTSGIGAVALGLFSFEASNGTFYTIGGTATALKAVSGTTWDDVSRLAGGAYAVATGDRWNFAAFGDRIIATDYTDVVQSYLAGTDTDFTLLAGSPPKAKYITVSGDFVVLAYINEGATAYPFRIRWSAQGDPTASWASSSTTLADFDDLDSNNGVITGVVGFADYFYVFQKRAITRYDFVGSPLVFRATEVVPGIGSVIPGSICRVGERVFFAARDGFKELSAGGIKHIGLGKLDKVWWLNNYPRVDINSINLITAFGDPNYPIVHFCVPDGSVTTQTSIYSYNYLVEKWTVGASWNSTFQGNSAGVIYNSTFPYGTVAIFRTSSNKLYHVGFTTQESGVTATLSTIPAQLSKNGNPVTITRIRLDGDFLGSPAASTITINAVGSPISDFTTIQGKLETSTAFTQVATNLREFVGRITLTWARFDISATNWGQGRSIRGIEILDMSESGKR